MKIVSAISERIERLRAAPREELGRAGRFAKFHIQLWRFCGRRLRENNAMAMSAALSFRTLFALVPALVLALLVLKSVGATAPAKANLRRLIAQAAPHAAALEATTAPTTAPAAGAADAEHADLVDELWAKVEQVEAQLTFGRIGPVGVVLLIWTALGLLTTVERSLNRIFGARRSRALGRRVLLYWSAMTLLPVLLAAAVYVGEWAVKIFRDVPVVSWLFALAGWSGPVVVGIVLLAAVYKLMPNTPVRSRSAIGGAVVAVPLWLLAKWGLAVYVQKFVVTGSLYGALGLLPLFLFWLNLSWLIFLFGAELAHTAANLGRMQSAEQAEQALLRPWDLLAGALAVAGPYAAGGGPVAFEAVAARLDLPDASVQRVLNRLAGLGVVCPVDRRGSGAYVLVRPPEAIGVLEVVDLAPAAGGQDRRAIDAELARPLERLLERSRAVLGGLTLADVLEGERAG